jgi:hypothetical protein
MLQIDLCLFTFIYSIKKISLSFGIIDQNKNIDDLLYEKLLKYLHIPKGFLEFYWKFYCILNEFMIFSKHIYINNKYNNIIYVYRIFKYHFLYKIYKKLLIQKQNIVNCKQKTIIFLDTSCFTFFDTKNVKKKKCTCYIFFLLFIFFISGF